jgi:hypothetical protein
MRCATDAQAAETLGQKAYETPEGLNYAQPRKPIVTQAAERCIGFAMCN